MPAGNPNFKKIYTPKKLAEISNKLIEYVDKTDIPIIAEFAYQNKILRQTLYEHEELADSIKYCKDKKEANLERQALEGKINHTMAIFSLKQFGWKDNIEIAGGLNIYNMSDKEVDSRIEEIEKRLKIK